MILPRVRINQAETGRSLVKDVFDTNRGLWLATDQNELYPNPHSFATECEFSILPSCTYS